MWQLNNEADLRKRLEEHFKEDDDCAGGLDADQREINFNFAIKILPMLPKLLLIEHIFGNSVNGEAILWKQQG